MLANFRSRFTNITNTDELIQNVLDVLPLSEETCKVLYVKGTVKRFTAHVKYSSDIDVKEFQENFLQKNNVTLRLASTKYCQGEYSKCVYFRCQHKTRYQRTMSIKEVRGRNPSGRNQNTNCYFSLALKFYEVRTPEGYLVDISMEWDHSHSITSQQSLSFKDVSADVAEIIHNLFEKGFTPSLAYAEFHRQKKIEFAQLQIDELRQLIVLVDRSKAPRRPDFNKLFTDFHRLKYGTKNLSDMYSKLTENINNFIKNSPDSKVVFQKYDSEADEPFILVLITPLMKRVHENLKTAGELVFFDSSGGMEEYNLRLFLMVTHSPIGALPLGIIITSDETLDTLVSALELFTSCLPVNAFYGRGKKGPAVIMTDNCSELRDALHAVWPNATLLLCIFHLMQQLWRWLFEKKHKISASDRQEIMKEFKEVLYAVDDDKTEENFQELLDNDVVKKYSNLLVYLQDLYEIKDTWCFSSRRELTLRGNNTNNYVESQFLVLKDNILNRTKEVNINGLFQKVTIDFDDHYRTKLLNAAAGSFDGIYSGRYKGKGKKTGKSGVGFQMPPLKRQKQIVSEIAQVGKSIYNVPSFTNGEIVYHVDMDSGMCTCAIGNDGSVCKHQYIVWTFKHRESINFIPFLSSSQRKEYSFIATGKVLPDEYYHGLHDTVLNADMTEDTFPDETVGQSINMSDENTDTQTQNEHREVQMIGRGPVDQWTVEECQSILDKTHSTLSQIIETMKDDQNFLKGVVKFCDRVEKYKNQPTKLSTSLHWFGNNSKLVSSKKSTAKSLLKKACTGKKIHCMPTLRRVNGSSKSKTAIIKGMKKHQNPFDPNRQVSTKRKHNFADNVNDNVAVAKKAGRSMSSKTAFKSSGSIASKECDKTFI